MRKKDWNPGVWDLQSSPKVLVTGQVAERTLTKDKNIP